MSEINLSNTPNTSALIVVRGEVQGNHVNNFGQVMRYGNVAVVSTIELEEAMPTVGVPLRTRGEYEHMRAQDGHRQNCAAWIIDHASQEFDLEPFTYDIHLLDGAADMLDNEGLDADRSHWRSVTQRVAERQPFGWQQDGGSGVWTYKPFKLVDKELEHFGREETGGRPTLEQLVDDLQSLRLPVRFSYATATLQPERYGKLGAARVTFGFPTEAMFQRSRPAKPGAVNEDGDRVHQTTEISSRTFRPEVPVELQIALDDATAAGRAAIDEAIQRHGDEDYYLVADDGTTEYNNEARFAPIYNLL